MKWLRNFNYRLWFTDAVAFVAAAVLVWFWRLLADKSIAGTYVLLIFCAWLLWNICSFVSGRYLRWLRNSTYKKEIITTLCCLLITALMSFLMIERMMYSQYVVALAVLFGGAISLIYVSLYFAYRYASNAEEEVREYNTREPHGLMVVRPDLSDESIDSLGRLMEEKISKKERHSLEQKLPLYKGTTHVITHVDWNVLANLQPYTFNYCINVMALNHLRGINQMFCRVNELLSDNGRLVCRFMSRTAKKQEILKRYPWGINYVIYTGYFLVKRVLPKLFLTNRLYFDITKGKNRALTTTEVLGRLYYCGYVVEEVFTVEAYTYVIARRFKQPEPQLLRRYGPFIKLPRRGKNGKMIQVYKMRTMHPYAEFLQGYIYEKNNLQEGGKFANDIRISTMGHFMRKYWLDELPMFINLLKGEMKLVGVRPLSQQYFNLYSKELQELRVQFLPGLLPPFYADMPKTLDDVQESEMKYLKACQQNGVFKTDMHYLWRIFYNILFKKARSK